MAVKPIPDGYNTLTPFLVAEDLPTLIEFLKGAFGATELMKFRAADGHVIHAEVKIGDTIVMMFGTMEGIPPMPMTLYLYVPNVDATYRAAINTGGESLAEPANQFWGDRTAVIADPLGNKWWIATHIEDVSPDELARRAAAVSNQEENGNKERGSGRRVQ